MADLFSNPSDSVPNRDRDVVAGFPVRRFLAMIVYANMIFVGGIFFMSMLEPLQAAVDYSDNLGEFFERVGVSLEIGWDLVVELLIEDTWVMLALPIPGTLGGICWYLLGRWRESRLIRQRQKASAEAGLSVSQSPLSQP